MKLESLEMENIRSYASASISFKEGVTLLEGDVGSGKSTILYAIEFALFGLGDLKAGHLLRHGADKGKVKLSLEVEGKKITVQRNLERKNETARQSAGWIEEDGLRTEYSPEEMKKQVLNLLQFRENPASRATSWIFRYAVFTPQEQMKEILSLKAEERLQTLRKAFGVEEYRNAQDNTALLQRTLREEARFIEGELKDLPELERKRQELGEKREENLKQIADQEEKTSQEQQNLDKAEENLKHAREGHSKLEKIGAELPLLKKRREEISWEKQANKKETEATVQKQANMNAELQRLSKQIQPIPENSGENWKKTEEALRKAQEELGAAEHNAKEHALLEKGVCPTCNQRISSDMHEKIRKAKEELAAKKQEHEHASSAEREARKTHETAQKQRITLQRMEDLKQQLGDLDERARQLEEKTAETLAKEKQVEEQWLQKQQQFSHYSEAKRNLEEAEAEKKTKQSALEKEKHALTQLQTSLKHIGEQQNETKSKIEGKKRKQEQLSVEREKLTWLEEHFLPSVKSIEHHVLHRINDEFNSLFRKWFAQLLETQDLEAEVDESFTPVIEQQGFEQDYTALSGGEKSALALAYRLSLNTMVRQTTPSLKNNLLILDEPTDGFSKEQLSRMRSVLEEAGAKQVIIVSHERELEGFCDRVYSVQKEHGKSSIKSA